MIANNSRAARMRDRLNRLRMVGIVAVVANAEQGHLGFFGLTKRVSGRGPNGLREPDVPDFLFLFFVSFVVFSALSAGSARTSNRPGEMLPEPANVNTNLTLALEILPNFLRPPKVATARGGRPQKPRPFSAVHCTIAHQCALARMCVVCHGSE